MLWLSLFAAQAAMTCEEVIFLVRSDVPRANILHTLAQSGLQEGAGECLLRAGVPMEYIEAAVGPVAPVVPRLEPAAVPQSEPAPEPEPAPPSALLGQRVDVEVVGLQIGVSKANGVQWDGTGTVSGEKRQALMGMVSNQVDASIIAGRVAEWGGRGQAAPDPLGFVELRGPRTPEHLRKKRVPFDKRSKFAKNTFTPQFARSYGFRGVNFTKGDALQVTVQDMEFQSKEMIGVAEIGFEQLAAAFDHQRVTPVYVGDQTNGQLLYVLITVRASSITGKAEAVGPLY